MSQNSHPSRSPEFLSRLHDGELSAAERAHFESHRAHCAECRNGAAEFEEALSMYRSSRTAPAAPDLAARILRRLQKKRSRRPGFGPSFGIDLRWAGAFAAAAIAAIIGSSVVARNEARLRAPGAPPIPVVLRSELPAPAVGAPRSSAERDESVRPGTSEPQVDASKPGAAEKEKRANLARQRPASSPDAEQGKKASAGPPPPAPARAKREEEKDATRTVENRDALQATQAEAGMAADEEARADAPTVAGALSKNSAAAPSSVPALEEKSRVAAKQAVRAGERSRGEGASPPSEPGGTRMRLVVSPLDGIPSVPPVIADGGSRDVSSLRGRSFRLVIDNAGRVRQAHVHPDTTPDRRSGVDVPAEVPPAILELRFRPGDRPRRLLVRFE